MARISVQQINDASYTMPSRAAAADAVVSATVTAATLKSLRALNGISPPVPGAGAETVTIGVETFPIRLTFHGATPTSTLGLLIPVGAIITLSVAAYNAAQVIGVGGTAALQISEWFAWSR
jgi:hypothetical protein